MMASTPLCSFCPSHQVRKSPLLLFSSNHQNPILTTIPPRHPRLLLRPSRRRGAARAAYVSAPASEPDSAAADNGTDQSSASPASISSGTPVSWGVIWPLLSQHKLRILVSLASLVGCTSCTLAMPILSGKFFEILIGRGTGPLWNLLSRIATLYALEPVFTVVFVLNMTNIWEKVMASLRGQIFKRMLIQKVYNISAIILPANSSFSRCYVLSYFPV